MTGMDWQRLARAIVDRRVDLGLHTREAFLAVMKADLGDKALSRRVVADLETGTRENYDQATLVRLEKALGWPAGAVYRVLRGQEADPDKPEIVYEYGEPVDLAKELSTAVGILNHLTVPMFNLAGMLHESGLTPEEIFPIVMAFRSKLVELERQEMARLAKELGGPGGRVPDTNG
jgi:hypothetical protein